MKLTPIEVGALSDGKDPSQVQKLTAANQGIKKVVGLDVCTSLTRLDVSSNSLVDVDGIAACSTLRWISIAKNQVTSLDPLRDLEGLEVLNAAHNAIQGKVAVGRLRALKALILNNNNVTSVGGLEKLKDLDTIVLSHNALSTLGGWLAGAERLQKLSASHNPLTDIGTALRCCPQLQELRLNHCQLTSLSEALGENSRLRILEVGGNQISTFEDLEVLRELPALRQLNLKGCPVADLPGYEDRVKEMVPRLEVLDSRRLVGGRGGHKQQARNGSSNNPFDQAMAGGPSAAEHARAQMRRPEKEEGKRIESPGAGLKHNSKRERDEAEELPATKVARGDSKSGKDKSGNEDPELVLKEGKEKKKHKREKEEKSSERVAPVAAAAADDDGAMDPAELKKAPKKKKKVDGDAQRTGVVRVIEVGNKGEKSKGKTKGGKQQAKETKKNNKGDSSKKDGKTALRGAAAIHALLNAPAAGLGGGVEELPGWD